MADIEAIELGFWNRQRLFEVVALDDWPLIPRVI
jgi:hypothetical protein